MNLTLITKTAGHPRLLLLISSFCCADNDDITVIEINLAYDGEKHVMTLTIPKEITDEISKPFFSYMGTTLDSSNSFFTLRPSNCKEVNKNSVNL